MSSVPSEFGTCWCHLRHVISLEETAVQFVSWLLGNALVCVFTVKVMESHKLPQSSPSNNLRTPQAFSLVTEDIPNVWRVVLVTDFQIRCPAAGAPPCLLGSLPHLHAEHVGLLA